jgi:hypothetical protein
VNAPTRSRSHPVHRSTRLSLSLAALLALPVATGAQVRGGPLFFESTQGYQSQLGLALGHGGELDGVSILATGSHHIGVGVRRRFAFSAAAGIWDPPDKNARFTGALGAQVRLDGLGRPVGRVSRLTIRAVTGIGMVSDGGRARWSVPIGIGAGYRIPAPVAHLEGWIVPHVIWLQRSAAGQGDAALPVGGDAWKAAVSAGVTVGAGKIAGLRIGTECCIGGLAAAYNLSAWF